ncbi:MAG: 50S ribosomal protein L10 [Candidatus Shikimatogenerans sp. AspAUS03]|uniref:Large ribosomal subunit protein uL10 n=1 Tax=Candidatus Shikimatogenerans sp. AspAUS03 TaxID=3158563 RepID=A0AAU7QSU9_9FLAO
MVKDIIQFVKKLNCMKYLFFLNIKNLKSEYLFKFRKKLFSQNIYIKFIKNSLFKKYIKNKRLLIKKIIKYNLIILYFYNINNILKIFKIIKYFKKKYNYKINIKSIYLNNKILLNNKDYRKIQCLKNKSIIIYKLLYWLNYYNSFIYIIKYKIILIYYILNKLKCQKI